MCRSSLVRRPLALLACLLAAGPAAAQIAGVAGQELIVPVVAHSGGAYGAVYATELVVSSEAVPPIELAVTLYPRDASAVERWHTVQALPSTLTLSALFGSLPETSGWLRVRASAPVRITSRTAGAAFHALPPSAALLPGESATLDGAMTGLGPDPKVRYNFGGAEISGRETTVRICVAGRYSQGWGPYTDSGPFRECRDVALAPHGSFQRNAFQGILTVPRNIVTSAEVTVTVTGGGGSVVAWATAIDAGNEATAYEMPPGAGLAPALGPSPGRLVLTKTGSGAGRVSLSNGTILCDTRCDAAVLALLDEPDVDLVAEPDGESVLTSFQGCDAVADEVCRLDEPVTRRVTVTFSRSRLTVDVFGFLDATVSAGAAPFSCPGPVRTCLFPIPPGAPVKVGSALWTGASGYGAIAFTGPGCGSAGCSLTVTADPTAVGVRMVQSESSRIRFFGAYPGSIRKGEPARLLVQASGCDSGQFLDPSAQAVLEAPGVHRVEPQETKVYTYYCYYRLPGSGRVDLETRSATVAVSEP